MTRALAYAMLPLMLVAEGCGTPYLIGPKSCQILVRRVDRFPTDEIKNRYAGQHLQGDYNVAVDRNGVPTDVKVARSIPSCDRFVQDYLRHWRFPEGSVYFTMHVDLVFALAAATATGGVGKYRALPEFELDHLIVERVAPPAQPGIGGSGYYMLYVEPDGTVSRVDVINSTGNADEVAKATLLRWRFRPTEERLRGPLHLAIEFKR